MYQITSENSVGMNQQHLGGGASIDKPAVARDPNLIQNLAMLFAKKIPFYLPTVNITLASLLVTLPKIQPLTSETLSFQVQSIGSGVILAANIEISLADPRSIKDIVTAALKEKKLLGLPDAFIFYGPDKEIINLEDMDVNGFSPGDRVTLTAKLIYWSDVKKQMIDAVTQNGMALLSASADLRNDRDVVLSAVTQYGWVLVYASQKLKADRKVVLAAVKDCGQALRSANIELRSNKDVVLAAVSQDGWALEYASPELRADRDVVLAAVRQNRRAFQYASAELQIDGDLLLIANRGSMSI